jgi:subtilisin family serine protease
MDGSSPGRSAIAPANRGRAARAAAIVAAGCVASAVAIAPGAAAGPTDAATPIDAAIVEVATPPLPASAETGSQRWRLLRAQSGDLLTRVAGANGLDVASRIPETGQLTVELEDGESVAGLRRRLDDDPRVRRVSPNHPVELRFTPNDPGFTAPDPNAPGGDFGQWNLSRAFAPPAWDLSTGAGAEVAVVDTGVDVTHPDLSRQVTGTADCTGGCAGTNVTDLDGHGTHVAGLACATTNNGSGIASVGFDCGLFPVRMNLTCGDGAAGVVAAANHGSDVINMSFGGACSSMVNELQYALGRNAVLVAAGDNSPNPPANDNYPAQWVQPLGTGPAASFNRGLVVTAANHSGARAGFAQQDSGVSVAAFGAAVSNDSGGRQGILSTWISSSGECGTCRTAIGGVNRYAYLVGTSMAAPQVAGLAALMRTVAPSLPAPDIADRIKRTASNCGTYVNGLGWGIVNAYRAVAAAVPGDITAPRSKVKRGRGKLRVKRRDPDETRACTSIEVKASGVKKVLVYVSVNGRDYRKLGKVKGKSIRFRGKKGKKYRFYSIAIDEAGNREAAPAEPDAKLNRKKKRRR